MPIRRAVNRFCLTGLLMVVGSGCGAQRRATGGVAAAMPQTRVHHDQLVTMSREDADSAIEPAGEAPVRAPAARDRRAGQLVIDQPRR